MSTETDLIKLYSARILALAADIPRLGRLDNPDATVSRRSPLCGSNVTVDIRARDGKIADYAAEVRACALGQAAASVVASNIVGCDAAQVVAARDQLRDMLRAGGPVPAAPFDGLAVLQPAKDYKNRHASILLTLEAAVEALEQAGVVTPCV